MGEPVITFSELLDPISVDQFFGEYFDKKALHVSGNRDKVADICSWGSFNELLQRTAIWSDHSFKLVLDGNRIPGRSYCKPAGNRDGIRVMQPVPEKVVKYLDDGASIVLDLVETLSPGLRAASEAIQMATCSRVTCNAYCSQGEHQAFPSHFDSMDVFAIHVEGKKTWRIYEGRFEAPMEAPGYDHTSFPPDYHEQAKGDVEMEVEMTPGDLLYLPKGKYHDALASTDNCLHLSYGTTEPTGIDFMRWLVEGLDEAPIFRKAMPPYDDVTAHEAHVKALQESLIEILQNGDAAGQFREDQRSKAFSMLSSVGIPEPLHRYRVRGRGVRIVRRGQERQIAAPDGNTKVPEGAHEMIDWILMRDHFERGDLAVSFPDAKEQLIFDLLQALASVRVIEQI